MNKNNIKKLIVSVAFIVILVILFLYGKKFNDTRINKEITIVNNIIKEKYDKVVYSNKAMYAYSFIKTDDIYKYSVFDLHGNRLYSFKSSKELNIVTAMKKYFIVFDDGYHLYNQDNEKIIDAKVIEALNDYIVKVDDKIYNLDNEVLYEDVHTINSYNNNNLFNINNYYLIDKKGNLLLENTIIEKEVKTNNLTNYYIIKKDNKYYTFFININQIIGDSFDSYKINKNVYIKNKNGKYKIYKTGLRKKIKDTYISKKIRNKYYLEQDNIINNKYAFVTNKKTNKSGIINILTNDFIFIKKGNVSKVTRISKIYYKIKINNTYFIYDINNKKVIYKSNDDINNILIFDNGCISYCKDNNYYLVSKKGKIIINLDKQIVLKNKKIIGGRVLEDFYIYDYSNQEIESSKKIIINDDEYYFYNNTIASKDFDREYSSKEYLSYGEKNIILKNDSDILFYDLKNDEKYSYKLKNNEEIINDHPYKNVILVEGKNKTRIINFKGEIIGSIKNKKIVNYYESNRGNLVIITSKLINGKRYEGSYVAK